jgi:hypothetical protein
MTVASNVHRTTTSFGHAWPIAAIVIGLVATLAWDALLVYTIVVVVRRLV